MISTQFVITVKNMQYITKNSKYKAKYKIV